MKSVEVKFNDFSENGEKFMTSYHYSRMEKEGQLSSALIFWCGGTAHKLDLMLLMKVARAAVGFLATSKLLRLSFVHLFGPFDLVSCHFRKMQSDFHFAHNCYKVKVG